eukprot:g1362.t1
MLLSFFSTLMLFVLTQAKVKLSSFGNAGPLTLSEAISQGKLNATEQTLFSENSPGKILHFWVAGCPDVDRATFRFYVDGEDTPSIEFEPPMAAGIGFDDQSAPWGNNWFGKGAASTGFFLNIPIPFNSIRVTWQLDTTKYPDAKGGPIWIIVRGIYHRTQEQQEQGLTFNNVELPSQARLKLIKHENVQLKPLEFIDLVNVDPGHMGLLFANAMQVSSGNFNFMEGCFHLYDQEKSKFPGRLISTGMEDYFDSAFYFNGGNFHLPSAGSTHKVAPGNWSGYRIHEQDPIFFNDGIRFQWRNGDVTDPSTGLKCTALNGTICGNPTISTLTSYSWIYVA